MMIERPGVEFRTVDGLLVDPWGRKVADRAMPVQLRRTGRDGLTVEGYATTFDDPYPVTDQLGTYSERVAKGAFLKTLRERDVVMQFDHGADDLFGNLTIGVWDTIEETDHGLHVVGRLNESWQTEPLVAAIESGSLKSMSIRMAVVKQDPPDFGPEHSERTIIEAALYEAGPVVFPANEGTEIMLRAMGRHLSERQMASLVGTREQPAAAGTDLRAEDVTPTGADAHSDSQPLRTGISARERKLWAINRSMRSGQDGQAGRSGAEAPGEDRGTQ